ncbi:MAG: Gfo/Idh/MocA family protein, partial [Alphaproteobacteria bacterium]
MSSDTLRGGLIGCGFFAQNHLHAWRDVAGAELVAVCDLDAAKAGAAARTFGVPNHYADAVEMFSGEELDFVDIVTTMPSHRSLVELAASKGVPAICQKPFAPTMKDAEAMVEACRSTGVALMVHENFRWQRPLMALHDAIAGGGIGQPFFGRISFRSSHDVYANQPYLAKEERFIILDLAIHLLDVARYLFGEARRLTCHAATIKEGIRGEDSATMLLGHESGATSIVDCSYAAVRDPDPFPETLIEVDGDEGSVRLD